MCDICVTKSVILPGYDVCTETFSGHPAHINEDKKRGVKEYLAVKKQKWNGKGGLSRIVVTVCVILVLFRIFYIFNV